LVSKLPVTAATPHVPAAACLLCAVSRKVVARVSRSQRLAIVAQAAPAKYDYDLVIIGCGVGGHGAALHAVEQVCMSAPHSVGLQGVTGTDIGLQQQVQLCSSASLQATTPSSQYVHHMD
jgi:hypothetical protein